MSSSRTIWRHPSIRHRAPRRRREPEPLYRCILYVDDFVCRDCRSAIATAESLWRCDGCEYNPGAWGPCPLPRRVREVNDVSPWRCYYCLREVLRLLEELGRLAAA